MTKKPNRFERLIAKHSREDDWGIPVVSATEVLRLLRREHAWMKRMVKAEVLPDSTSQKIIGWNQAIECILDKLEQRH